MGRNADWKGYGPNWDKLRKKTLERDNYTCQRCGYDPGCTGRSVPLQAHHIVPRSDGGADSLDNLITLCRSCHGVQHPKNESFDDDRPLAPLFPYEAAEENVSQMRSRQDHICSRCSFRFDSSELAGIPRDVLDTDEDVTVCKPCAGVICSGVDDLTVEDLFGKCKPTEEETIKEKKSVHPKPIPTASRSLRVSREPANLTEKYLINGIFRFLGTTGFILIFFALLVPPEDPSGGIVIGTWVAACILAPIFRWGGGSILLRISMFLDPTHHETHYKPSFKQTVSRIGASIVYAISMSIGLLFAGIAAFVVLGIIALILTPFL